MSLYERVQLSDGFTAEDLNRIQTNIERALKRGRDFVTTSNSIVTGTGVVQSTSGSVSTRALVPGQVLFGGADALIDQDATLYWDTANATLGIGTAAPSNYAKVHVYDSRAATTNYYWSEPTKIIVQNPSATGLAGIMFANDQGFPANLTALTWYERNAAIWYSGDSYPGTGGTGHMIFSVPQGFGGLKGFSFLASNLPRMTHTLSGSTKNEWALPGSVSTGMRTAWRLTANTAASPWSEWLITGSAADIVGEPAPYNHEKSTVLYHQGGVGEFRVAMDVVGVPTDVIVANVNGTIDLVSLAAGGYVKAAITTGKLSVVAAIPVADVTGAVATTRTLSGTSPVRIDGAASADLSANRTISLASTAASVLFGRGAGGGAGAAQEITLGSGLSLAGTVLSATGSGGTVTAVTASLPLTSSGGTTPNIALNYDAVSITLNGSNQIQRAALTGDITAVAGSNTTAFRAFLATSVLANATGAGAVPTELAASANNQVLQRVAGVLAFAQLDYSQLTGTPTLYYQTIENAAGAAQTQRTVWRASTGLTAADIGGVRTNVTVDLSTGIAGGQSAIGGTAASENLTLSSTANVTKGEIRLGGSTNGFSESTGKLFIGLSSAAANARLHVHQAQNATSLIGLSNSDAGAATVASVMAATTTLLNANSIEIRQYGTGYTTSGLLAANVGELLHTGDGNMLISHANAINDIVFTTTASRSERARIASGGNVSVANLTAGGVVYATAATGVLTIGTSANVAAAITWPTAGQVLVSSGTTTAPVGDVRFTYDTASDLLTLAAGATQAWYNVDGANYERVRAFWLANEFNITSERGGTGTVRPIKINGGTNDVRIAGGAIALQTLTAGGLVRTAAGTGYVSNVTLPASGQVLVSAGTTADPVGDTHFTYDTATDLLTLAAGATQAWYNLDGATNYERVRASWGLVANTFLLKSEAGGTGVVRGIQIEGNTANVVIQATGTGGYVAFGQSFGVNPDIVGDADRITLRGTQSIASAASVTLDAVKFDMSGITVTGTTHVTDAGGVNAVSFPGAIYNGTGGAKTIDYAATVKIGDGPDDTGDLTIANKYALWVDAGAVRFDAGVLGSLVNKSSAANLSIKPSEANLAEVTGATTVHTLWTGNDTNVDAWTYGSIITIVCETTGFTVKHNGTGAADYAVFDLSGNVDYVMAVGDSLTVYYTGASWKEIGRSAA